MKLYNKMSTDCTSINTLPGNQINKLPNSEPQTDFEIISTISPEITQAEKEGLLNLPSRDIPMNTEHVQMEQVDPLHIPDIGSSKYIPEDNINNYNNINMVDDDYKIPLLITLLYFLFSLPYVKNLLFINLKSLFKSDGNYNMKGHTFVSILFGALYFMLNKLVVILSN